MKRSLGGLLLLAFVSGLGCAGSLPSKVDVDVDSIVTGRIEGRVVAKAGELYRIDEYVSEEWRIEGFELMNSDTDEVKKLRLDRKGYFAELVQPGSYVLQRSRRGEKDYRERETVTISSFDVSPGKLVNLGTYKVAIEKPEGNPLHSMMVSFRIYHRSDPDSVRDTMNWFSGKNPDLHKQYEGRVVDFLSSGSDPGGGTPKKSGIVSAGPGDEMYAEDDCIRKKIYKSDFARMAKLTSYRRDWPVGDYKDASFSVAGEKYVFRNKNSRRNIIASHSFLLSSEQGEDFTFDTTFSRDRASGEEVTSVWFGGRSNFLAFGLKGNTLVYYKRDRDRMRTVQEKASDHIKESTNRMIITRRGDRLRCYVNGRLLADVRAELGDCGFFGFEIIGDAAIEVKSIYVTLDRKPDAGG